MLKGKLALMEEEEIPDLNLFMMCEQLNKSELSPLSKDYTIRPCRPDEFDIWKAFPFDKEEQAKQYKDIMTNYFTETYSENKDLFFTNTLFVCDQYGKPIATCSSWKAYGKFNTIQWFKTRKSHEGKGIGRALLSVIMKRFDQTDYPVFLHTQPGSFRAIKLYADFGFNLLAGQQFGTRKNDLDKSLPILKEFMPEQDYKRLKIVEPPVSFVAALRNEKTNQF